MHKASHPILLFAAALVALPSLGACRRAASERAVAERSPASDAGTPADATRPAVADAAVLEAPYNASRSDCPVSIDAARVRLAHRATWNKEWSKDWSTDEEPLAGRHASSSRRRRPTPIATSIVITSSFPLGAVAST